MKRLIWGVLFLSVPLSAGLSAGARSARVEEAQALCEKKDYDGAAKLFLQALDGAKKRERKRWWPMLGRAYEEKGDFQRALSAYQEAYALDDGGDRMIDLARLYSRVDLSAQAIDLYQKALKSDPGRNDVRVALAGLLRRAGRLREARAAAEAAVAREPRDISAQGLLADMEEVQGDLPAAARRREKILTQAPSAEGYFKLARLWMKLEEKELSLAALGQAEKFGEDPALVNFLRAAWAWRQDDHAAVQRLCRDILSKSPDFEPALVLAALDDPKAGGAKLKALAARTTDPFIKDLAALISGKSS